MSAERLEYQRGWAAHADYEREAGEVRRAYESARSPSALAFVAAIYAFMFNIAWPVALFVHGNWQPWLFMLGIGAVVSVLYLNRASRRGRVKADALKAKFEARWK